MQVAQFVFNRLVFGEFHQVAAPQKFAQLFLLFRRQQIRAPQLVQKFLGRAFRRVEIKSFFEIGANRVGDQGAKRLGMRNQRERFSQHFLRANVGRHQRHNRNLRSPLLPPTPGREHQRRHGQCAKRPPKPFPAAWNVHRRLDVADVVDIRHFSMRWQPM